MLSSMTRTQKINSSSITALQPLKYKWTSKNSSLFHKKDLCSHLSPSVKLTTRKLMTSTMLSLQRLLTRKRAKPEPGRNDSLSMVSSAHAIMSKMITTCIVQSSKQKIELPTIRSAPSVKNLSKRHLQSVSFLATSSTSSMQLALKLGSQDKTRVHSAKRRSQCLKTSYHQSQKQAKEETMIGFSQMALPFEYLIIRYKEYNLTN